MSPDEFLIILRQIKPYTNYIYLHVLGEPLLHPQLEDLLIIAKQEGFWVNITTNGSLIQSQQEILSRQPIRQFNISLHGAEENIKEENLESFLESVFLFAKQNSDKSFFSFRLWNANVCHSSAFNLKCLDFMNKFFATQLNEMSFSSQKDHILAHNIYLQRANRFSWPGEKKLSIQRRKCYAIKDHVGILVDGKVVPCCLDGEGKIDLGNIFQEDFGKILSGEKICTMQKNFQNHIITEALCKDCGFFIN
jgi:radical SAM protein with 4Fe4S-binding SPASM domain